MENQSVNAQHDTRLDQILAILTKFATGDYTERAVPSGKGDKIDSVLEGLNAVADEAHASRKVTRHYFERVERLMQVLLKYTVMDFSETLEVSGEGDEIDAIAIGLNTLATELVTARHQEAEQLLIIRESKEQIETILNSAPSAVIVIDQESNVLTWNTKAEEIFGWKFEEVLNQPMHRFIMPQKHVDSHYKGMEKFLETGNGPILNNVVEITAMRKNGLEFPIEMAISAVRSKGKYVFIAFIVDISARKKSESELLLANKRLEESNSELEAFTYSVSHDLRAPLRALNSYSQLLSQRSGNELSDQAKKFIESIAANSRRMGRLIDDLLSLSRYSRADVKRSEVDMNNVVRTVVEELKSCMDLRKTKIIIDHLPPVSADNNLVLQVYSNLISNAVKYSSQKPDPQVTIGSEEKNGETVYFVKDNGSGFDMQFYDKLFGVFQRLHDSTEFEGTGVGLAVVKRIITKHGGKVWAESEIDKGSSFYFTLR